MKQNIISKYFKSFSISCLLSFLSIIVISDLSLAGDPFRTKNERNISETTENAFKALFEEGNYLKSKEYLIEASKTDNNDPLVHAIKASLAYTESDWEGMKNSADKTIEIAKKIKSDDPLRSNLYLGVGSFLEGGYIFQKQGVLPAINKLQEVFYYFEEAEKVDKDDPELNLIQGYLNLFLSVKLPFSNAEEAIERLKNYASPKFLVNRGIAIAYRDLKNYDEALKYVELAIESTPLNPELYYLKGQILREKGDKEENITLLQEALKNFNITLAKVDQLPAEAVKKPLTRDIRITQEKIDKIKIQNN